MRGLNWIIILMLAASGCKTLASSARSTGELTDTERELHVTETTGTTSARSTRERVLQDLANSSSRRGEIQLASQQAPEEIPRPAAKPSPPAKPAESPAAPEGVRPVRNLDPASRDEAWEPLSLREVSESVYVAFPALEALRQEMNIAEGKRISAWGEFDLKIKAEGLATPLGYYENYRNALKLEQGVFRNGANLFGQYRIGDGNIQPWYGGRETNEGGEFSAGLILPLLRDRSIDQRRADIFQATLRRQQVDPIVQASLLEFNLAAADAYWSWVAAGLNYDVQYELMLVTVERNEGFEERVKQKDLARIELVQNRRLIATREAKVIESERKLQQTSIKLAMFLRDAAGQPMVPPPALLPVAFPKPELPDDESVGDAIVAALNARPELVELDIQREQAAVDLAAGQNLRLPSINAVMDASKDVGAPSSEKGNKTPFQLEAGLLLEVPLQRRKADGKIREAQGKLAQIAAKRQLTENKIEVQVRDALSALRTSYDRVIWARESLTLARELEQAERDRFEAGESDLLRVAIQETAKIEAAMIEIESLADFYKAQAALGAALGADPMARE